jgi:hypothetical protein
MAVNINITEEKYEFINGATGEKLSAEEFAKKYPAVELGGHRGNPETKENKGGVTENKE